VFALIGWLLFGLFIGAVARLLVPGEQAIGLLGTMLVGVVGSFVGGFLSYLIFGGQLVQATGWIGSIIGAVILVVAVQRLSGPPQREG